MSRRRKILYSLLGLIAASMVVGTAMNWRNIQMVATYNPILLPTWYGEPDSKAEARQQDLEHLKKFTDIDRSFSPAAKSAFSRLIAETGAHAETITDAEFYLTISQAAALADNGHTNVSDQPLHRQFNSIGAKLYWFADGLFIVRADATHADLIGSRVRQIEGKSLDEVISTLRQYRGGAEPWRKLAMPMMIESPQFMHAAGLATSPDAIAFSLENTHGEIAEVTFAGQLDQQAADLPFRRAWESLLSKALPGENETWTRALKGDTRKIATYLEDADDPMFRPLPGNGRYIRTQSGFGTKTQSTAEFLASTLAGVDDASLDYLVVDQRWNAGGDYTQAVDFSRRAPGKVKDGGKLYLIVGPQTFSAAVVTTAMLKYYGGEKSIIVGTPMGDREQFWAERGMSFKLPNSGFYVNYATGYHDWEKGCTGQKYCFTFNVEHEVPAGSLKPTVVIDPSYADYASGRDVVLDWILAQ